jgi:hypothetical protein
VVREFQLERGSSFRTSVAKRADAADGLGRFQLDLDEVAFEAVAPQERLRRDIRIEPLPRLRKELLVLTTQLDPCGLRSCRLRVCPTSTIQLPGQERH